MTKSLKCVPREMVERKPKHGSPCNNCGLCCWSSKCDIGRALFPGPTGDGPCPALRFDTEQNSYCDVMAAPERYTDADPETARAAAKLLLYAGWGCTMRINGEMNDEFHQRLCSFDASNESELKEAAALWKIKAPNMF